MRKTYLALYTNALKYYIVLHMKTLYILHKTDTQETHHLIHAITEYLHPLWAVRSYALDSHIQKNSRTTPDAYLILGGDGTILHGIFFTVGYEAPTISINTGNLGFLATLTLDTWRERLLPPLEQGTIVHAPLLQATLHDTTTYAFNDIVVTRNGIARNISICAHADNTLLYTFKGDGLIIATPYGSSAYARSAGGSLIHPSIAAYIITPILPSCVHIPPIILPHTTTLTITTEGDVTITCDGQRSVCENLRNSTTFTVQCTKPRIPLIHPCSEYYFEHIRSKHILP